MKEKDIKIDLGPVQETLLIPLWARAQEAKKKHPLLVDDHALEAVNRIDYDFSSFEKQQTKSHQFVWPIRAYNFDIVLKDFIKKHSNSTIINIGAGLDTTFQRIDNGIIRMVNIDLPDVAGLRNKLIPDSEREKTFDGSVFDFSWMELLDKNKHSPIMFMAAGVLCYFTPENVKKLLIKLSELFPSSHLIFDSMSWLTVWGSNRQLMKETGIDPSAFLKWHLNRASQLKKILPSIKIIEEFPMFSRLPSQTSLDRSTARGMRISDLLRLYQMAHIQF